MNNNVFVVDANMGGVSTPRLPAMDIPLVNSGLVANDFESLPTFGNRRVFLQSTIDPRRDINAECGYLETMELDAQKYRDMYDREPIATRVVEVLPKECWQKQPTVYEDDDNEHDTPFELAWKQLPQTLRGTSWHLDDDNGNIVWEMLRRADILSGIGHFGVILLGIDDGAELSDPVEGFEQGWPTLPDSPRQGAGLARMGSVGAGSGLGTDLQYGKLTTFLGDTTSYIHNRDGIQSPAMSYSEARKVIKRARGKGHIATMHMTQQSIVVNHQPADSADKESIYQSFRSVAKEVKQQFTENKDQWYVKISRCPVVNAAPQEQPEDDPDPNQTGVQPADLDSLRLDDPKSEDLLETDINEDDSIPPMDADQGDQFDTTGVADASEAPQQDMDQPPQKVETKRKLLFMRVFDESLVQITRYEADPTNPRFGHPVMYLITINDPREMHSGIGLTTATVSVHWSRVIHVADNLNNSEVFGVPRQRSPWNRLCDLVKIYGGSAEGVWRGVFMGLAFTTHPQLGGDVQIDQDAMREQLERYQNSFQRHLALTGMNVNPLAPQIADVASHIDKEIEAICIVLGCPKRKFMGSERGELASGQDEGDWNGTVQGRQTNYVTPKIIVPFIDRLIMIGILPQPMQYRVEWAEMDKLSAQEKAQVMAQRTQAYSAYMQGGVDALMAPQDYLVHEGEFTEEEAEAILANTQQHMLEANPEAISAVPGAPPQMPAPTDPMTGEAAPMKDGQPQFAPQPEQHTHTGDSHEHYGDSHFAGGGDNQEETVPPSNGKPPTGSNGLAKPPTSGNSVAKPPKPGFGKRFGPR